MASREEIISEIRRIAASNNGRGPGWKLFRSETGLPESSWRGRFWPKWSDALTEAGFRANERSTAYPEADLFTAFIGVARNLGHLPTSSEYKLAARHEENLPSLGAFKRVGGRATFVQRLAVFVRSKPDLADVLPLFDQPPRETVADNSAFPRLKDKDDGFVYLIKSGRFFKIGRSNAAGRREREIALQLPDAARTIHIVRTDDPVGIEAYWHSRFAEKRKNGEWFDLSGPDVAAFKRRKFM